MKHFGRNPRQISKLQFERLQDTLSRLGDLSGIVHDLNSDQVIGGNQRVRALDLLGREPVIVERYSSPTQTGTVAEGYYEIDGERFAYRAVRWMSEQCDEANITANLAGGDWNWDVLSSWDTQTLKGWGLDEGALRGWNDDAANLSVMLEAEEEAPPEDPGAQVDRAEELREKWQTATGQLWEIGRHLLLCGDSTDSVSVLGMLPDNLIYDPPWDGDIDTQTFKRDWRGVLGFADGYRARDVIDIFGLPTWVFVWDCVTSWNTPNRPLRRGKLALWFGDVGTYQFDGAHYGEPLEAHTVKNTRGEYQFKPDPRGKHLSDVFQMGITQLHSDDGHKHEKPLDWVRLLIGDCLRGDIYDPFIGSGTTMVAAEQLGRRCVGVELEPMHVALALQRLCDMGLAPRLVDMQQDHS